MACRNYNHQNSCFYQTSMMDVKTFSLTTAIIIDAEN